MSETAPHSPETPLASEPEELPSAFPREDQAHPWTDLPAERFQLLRLAPLPIERKSGARPLRFVELGRVERHHPRLSLLRLSLALPGQLLHKEDNLLEIWVDHGHKRVRLGPAGGLSLNPENRGLGRFILAQAILWLRQRWAHYLLEGQLLQPKNPLDEELRQRREQMLDSLGIAYEYLDPLFTQLQLKPCRISELKGEWNRDKVQLVSLLEHVGGIQQADQNLREQDARLRQLDEQLRAHKRDEHGLRFTITSLLVFCLFQTGLLIWMALA